MTSQSDTEALKALVALGKRMRDTDKAAADAWNQPTDAEHDRLSLEADHLFEDFGHAAEAALPSLERMLASQTPDMVLVPREPTEEMLEAGSAVKAKFSFRETRIDVYKAMLSAAPVASQMGEPEALWHWVCNNQSDFGQAMDFLDGCRPLNPEITPLEIIVRRYAAPAAGMDVDKHK